MRPLSADSRAWWTTVLSTLTDKQRAAIAFLLRDKHGQAPA
jgi:hypothetical protein